MFYFSIQQRDINFRLPHTIAPFAMINMLYRPSFMIPTPSLGIKANAQHWLGETEKQLPRPHLHFWRHRGLMGYAFLRSVHVHVELLLTVKRANGLRWCTVVKHLHTITAGSIPQHNRSAWCVPVETLLGAVASFNETESIQSVHYTIHVYFNRYPLWQKSGCTS